MIINHTTIYILDYILWAENKYILKLLINKFKNVCYKENLFIFPLF